MIAGRYIPQKARAEWRWRLKNFWAESIRGERKREDVANRRFFAFGI
jgi:hypothetical protein